MEHKFSEMIQTSARGSMVLIVGRMLSSFISAAGTILIARILGSQNFGVMNIALIPINLIVLLVSNGTSTAIIRHIAEYRSNGEENKINEIIVCGFVLNLSISIIVTIIMFLLSSYLANQVFSLPEIALIIRILSFSLLSQALVNTSSAIIVGFEKMNQSTMVQILNSTLKTIIGPTLVFLGFGVAGAAYGYTLPLLFSGIFGLLLVILNIPNLKLSLEFLSLDMFKTIIIYVYPLFFANILAGGIHRVLEFLLSVNTTTEIMGNYSAAISFSIIIQFFTSPISTATFPLLSKIKPEDSIFKTVYQNIIKYESMIVFPVTFAIIGLSNQSIDILYGPTYHQASLYLQIYMLSSFLVGIGGSVNNNLLNSQKHTKVTFQSTVITLILSIILGFPLIPRYGVIGRLVVFLVAPTAGLLYTTIWLRRNYELNPDYWNVMELFTSAGIGFLVCRAFVTYVNMNTWLEFFFGGSLLVLTYLILILLTGALKKENLRDIQNIAKTYTFLNFILDPLFRVLNMLARK